MPIVQRLCIIGVGLIGGSLARAARRSGIVGEIVGCGRRRENLEKAVELGVVDRVETDIASAVEDADMVFIAVPVGAVERVLRAMKGHLANDAVITDVGSTKGSVIRAMQAAFGTVPPTFVPGHPIAGTEKSGVEASFAELFENRRVILTPLAETDMAAVEKVRALWVAAGAEVVNMDAEHHDRVLAATSHLPHLLAYALVDSLARLDDTEEIFRYAAGGFRDFTRIASSDPIMWRDICVANREALLAVLARFTADLDALKHALEQADGQILAEVFGRAKSIRDRFCG